MRQRLHTGRRRAAVWIRAALMILGVAASIGLGLCAWTYAQLRSSLPRLDGTVAAQGLFAPVTVARDAQGVPTLTGPHTGGSRLGPGLPACPGALLPNGRAT